MTERTAVFIDGGYLQRILKEYHNRTKVDFGKVSAHFAQGSDLLRTYYYDCLPYQSAMPTPEEAKRFADKQRFFEALARLPRYQVRVGKLVRRGVAPNYVYEQKRVDILLSVDMVELAATRQIQRAVLFAGDSDFVPAVEAVKRHGVLTVLWHGPRASGVGNTVHDELWNLFDERAEFDAAAVAACMSQALPQPQAQPQ